MKLIVVTLKADKYREERSSIQFEHYECFEHLRYHQKAYL